MIVKSDWTGNAVSIRKVDQHRHKYADALTEYVHHHVDAWGLDAGGDSDAPCGWFAPIGTRRLLRGDSYGFVWIERFDKPRDRDNVADVLGEIYALWSDDCDWLTDLSDDERTFRMADLEQYLIYVYACQHDRCEPHSIIMWDMHGRPRGPIGGQ